MAPSAFPCLVTVKKGEVEEKFLAFTTSAPSWTQISRVVVDKIIQNENGNRVAAVVNQFRNIAPQSPLELIMGDIVIIKHLFLNGVMMC